MDSFQFVASNIINLADNLYVEEYTPDFCEELIEYMNLFEPDEYNYWFKRGRTQ